VEGRVVHLTLNQTLEIIKLSEEGMSKAKTGRKLGLLVPNSQAVNATEKLLKEIKMLLQGTHE